MNCEKTLYEQLRNEIEDHVDKEIIIVCVGTDRSTGDSLGPLVGSYLSECKLKAIRVFGTIDEPVHAVNLKDTLNYIEMNHPYAFVIGIDACLGRIKSVGKVIVDRKPLKPGAGLNKELPEVGQVSIKGVVNVSGYMEFFVLQNTRLSLVMKMAREITEIINKLDHYVTRKYKTLQEVAATK